MIRGVVLDLGGVLHVGDALLPGAAEGLLSLRSAGIPLRYVSNSTRRTAAELSSAMSELGLEVPAEALFTPARAARATLAARGLRPLMLVHPRLLPDLAGLTETHPNAVLVGDAGEFFSYARLNAAFRLLVAGARLLALSRNRYFAEPDGLSLDAGPFVTALEHASGQTAELIGKPAATLFQAAIAGTGIDAGEWMMIGDDVEADVLGARAVGMRAVLVRSGKFRPPDEARAHAAGAWVCAGLNEAVDHIL